MIDTDIKPEDWITLQKAIPLLHVKRPRLQKLVWEHFFKVQGKSVISQWDGKKWLLYIIPKGKGFKAPYPITPVTAEKIQDYKAKLALKAATMPVIKDVTTDKGTSSDEFQAIDGNDLHELKAKKLYFDILKTEQTVKSYDDALKANWGRALNQAIISASATLSSSLRLLRLDDTTAANVTQAIRSFKDTIVKNLMATIEDQEDKARQKTWKRVS